MKPLVVFLFETFTSDEPPYCKSQNKITSLIDWYILVVHNVFHGAFSFLLLFA